ncbi:MAG: ABC transporter permease [Candidatus Kryptonium sp.]
MILRFAWRNIWRNKRRTIVVVLSIVVSVAVLLLVDTLSVGMIKQMLDNQINIHISHIQIHKKGFRDDKTVKNYIPDDLRVEKAIMETKEVKFYSRRVITYGMMNSAYNSSGVTVVGIQPDKERFITIISNSISQGKYLESKGEILLSEKLAQKLNVEVGDKIILMVSDVDGNISSELFRVVGLYKSPYSEFDKIHAYITIEDAQRILKLGDKVIEFALIVEDQKYINSAKENLVQKLGDTYEVLTYADVAPFIGIMLDVYYQTILVYYFIFGVAVCFGIINIMLMSVFERVREFGVLKAIGMKNKNIFLLIMTESFIIGVLGTIIGLVLGFALYIPLSKSGINLGIFSESLAWFGTGSIIYPVLTGFTLALLIFTMPFVSLIGAIYPAVKSIKLEPVEAIKHI